MHYITVLPSRAFGSPQCVCEDVSFNERHQHVLVWRSRICLSCGRIFHAAAAAGRWMLTSGVYIA